MTLPTSTWRSSPYTGSTLLRGSRTLGASAAWATGWRPSGISPPECTTPAANGRATSSPPRHSLSSVRGQASEVSGSISTTATLDAVAEVVSGRGTPRLRLSVGFRTRCSSRRRPLERGAWQSKSMSHAGSVPWPGPCSPSSEDTGVGSGTGGGTRTHDLTDYETSNSPGRSTPRGH